MFFRTLRLTVAMIALLTSTPGCGESKGNVSGMVTFAGAPLPSGKVTFICEAGNKPVLTANIRDGRYEIKGIPVGEVKITVATYKPSQPAKRPAGLGPTARPENEETPRPAPEKYVEIPARYAQTDTSKLTYIVRLGDQENDIPLTP